MALVTLATMRANALRYADLLTGQVDSADVDALLNDGLGELYELIADSQEDYYSTTVTVTLDDGEDSAVLPDDYWRSPSLADESANSSNPPQVPTFEWRDRSAVARKSFCIHGGELVLRPSIRAPGQYLFTYTPGFEELSGDGATFNAPNGWQRLAELSAAISLRTAQELSTTALEERYKRMRERVENASRQRKGSRKVRDVRALRTTPLEDEGFE